MRRSLKLLRAFGLTLLWNRSRTAYFPVLLRLQDPASGYASPLQRKLWKEPAQLRRGKVFLPFFLFCRRARLFSNHGNILLPKNVQLLQMGSAVFFFLFCR